MFSYEQYIHMHIWEVCLKSWGLLTFVETKSCKMHFSPNALCSPLPVDYSESDEIAQLKGKYIFSIAPWCQRK